MKYAKKARLKGEREFILEDYYDHIKSMKGDGHHAIPRSRIGRNDFFLVPLTREEHTTIHAGSVGVNGYIEAIGGYGELLRKCIGLFGGWVNELPDTDGRKQILTDLWFAIDTDENLTVNTAVDLTRAAATAISELR